MPPQEIVCEFVQGVERFKKRSALNIDLESVSELQKARILSIDGQSATTVQRGNLECWWTKSRKWFRQCWLSCIDS